MSRRSYERMMFEDPEGFHDPLERIDFVVRMHFLQDQQRHRRLAEGLRTALKIRATEQVTACLQAWEDDEWDDMRRARRIRDTQDLVRAQIDTLDKYMRDVVRTRVQDEVYTQGKHGEPIVHRETKGMCEALWVNALATVDWDRIVDALPVGKCDDHVAEPNHPTQESLYWALVRRQIGAQVLELDAAQHGPVGRLETSMCNQEYPIQWTAHDLSTMLGDQDRGKTSERRRAIRYAMHFVAETPYGSSSTLTLWTPPPVDAP